MIQWKGNKKNPTALTKYLLTPLLKLRKQKMAIYASSLHVAVFACVNTKIPTESLPVNGSEIKVTTYF